MKKKVLEYGITTFVCSMIVLVFLLVKGTFFLTETKTILHHLVDGFFISGILCTCLGAFTFVSNEGAFDFIIYGLKRFFSLFRRKPGQMKYNTYYDYQIAKAEKPKAEFLFLLIVGFAFIGISLILLYYWYQAPEIVVE